MIKKIFIVLTFALLFVAGCAVLYDYWPTTIPQDTLTYVGEDVNSAEIRTLGDLKATREATITKHLLNQIDYKYEMEKDKVHYTRAIDQANVNIEQAIAERSELIGTINNPGWLLGLALASTGIGAYVVGKKTQRPEDWNETEHQEEVAKAVEAALKVQANVKIS